jgi:hypothetical protein
MADKRGAVSSDGDGHALEELGPLADRGVVLC